MRTIRISDDVYEEIAKRGSFGETVDDVLRRVFEIEMKVRSVMPTGSSEHATRRMSAEIHADATGGNFEVVFEGGVPRKFTLPPPGDPRTFRPVLDSAVQWARGEGAADTQIRDLMKRLNQFGYYVRGSRL